MTTTEDESRNPNPRPRADSLVDAESLIRVGNAIDGLVVFTRAGFRRALSAMGALVLVSLALVVAVGWVLVRSFALADRVDHLLAEVELVAAEQSAAKVATEKVSEKVDVAAAAAGEKPDITIAPATSAAPGQKAKSAVLVIKAARPKPAASSSASASAPSAPPAQIEIPIAIPSGATLKPAPSTKP